MIGCKSYKIIEDKWSSTTITRDNKEIYIKGRNCEYALRCNPNIKKGKGRELWDELLKYEVEYSAENF